MNATEEILARAWLLALEDPSDEIDEEFEAMLPTLVAAGYAESDDIPPDRIYVDVATARSGRLRPHLALRGGRGAGCAF